MSATSTAHPAEYATWLAMKKFAANQPLTEPEWAALSELTLIDTTNLCFEPGNVRWAKTGAERRANRLFYQSIDRSVVQ